MRLAVTFVSVCLFHALGCDDPGGTSGVTGDVTTGETADAVSEVAADTAPAEETSTPDEVVVPVDTTPAEDTTPPTDTVFPDTAPAEDTSPPVDTTPADTAPPEDTTPADTTPPSDTNTACEACPPVGTGPTGISIVNDSSSTPPILAGLDGGAPMSDAYEIRSITVYTKGAFDGFFVTGATVSDNGQSSGTANFVDDRWAFFLDLDLTFTAQTILGEQGGSSRNEIQGGGCFTLADNEIVSDTSACAEGWPEGTEPPDRAEFGYDDASGLFELKIVLEKEFITALIPPEYQSIASSAIVGPITFIAELEAAP